MSSPAQKPTTIIAYEPMRSLQNVLGEDFDIRSAFTEDRIASCQGLIDTARKDFFTQSRPYVDQLKGFIKALSASEQPEEQGKHEIATLAGGIKSHAQTLGFPLIATLCDYVVQFAQSSRLADAKFKSVLGKVIDALDVAMKMQIADNGGEVGKELLANLDRVMAS